MLFHRRQDAQIALDTSRVVIANILLDHLNKLVLADEPSAVIAFPFQDAPEALHWAVINAMRHAGHTLRHPSLHKLVVEGTVGVLEPSCHYGTEDARPDWLSQPYQMMLFITLLLFKNEYYLQNFSIALLLCALSRKTSILLSQGQEYCQ